MASAVNVNCDLGESFGRWRLGNDEELIRHVPTANVACGFHAGDPHVMRRTVELAREHGVEVGAHVGLPDLVGFGRRRLDVSGDEVRDLVLYQLGALRAFADAAGVPVTHVKPHGVLYAMCGEREDYASGLLEAVAAVDPSLVVIVGGAAAGRLGAGLGVTVTAEGYVDLAYRPDGFPVIERVKEAWHPDEVARRAVRLVKERAATAVDGSELSVDASTICIHGDAPNAVEVARTLRERLEEEGVEVLPLRAALRAR